mmetsp:Transcript_10655/g.21544  ORF Transcript_10655/g.21544 Transcript_10655/m.21544 type:complete len:221 (-) Transcript_10655:82-744(-)
MSGGAHGLFGMAEGRRCTAAIGSSFLGGGATGSDLFALDTAEGTVAGDDGQCRLFRFRFGIFSLFGRFFSGFFSGLFSRLVLGFRFGLLLHRLRLGRIVDGGFFLVSVSVSVAAAETKRVGKLAANAAASISILLFLNLFLYLLFFFFFHFVSVVLLFRSIIDSSGRSAGHIAELVGVAFQSIAADRRTVLLSDVAFLGSLTGFGASQIVRIGASDAGAD